MINDSKDSSYPAYYMKFGENDPEVEFAKAAVKNTKADLRIYEMKSSDFIDAFNFQSKVALQPIGESSTIAIAYFFKQCGFKNHLVLDGTLADGCYGSTNYLNGYPVQSAKSMTRSRVEEKIASFLQLNHLPGGYKFFPRDGYINDSFIQQLNVYVGPLGNTLFKNVNSINSALEKYFEYYYKLFETRGGLKKDDWMMYSLFKMYNYASKNNTAKSFDNVGTNNSACYPFMWKEVLDNQGQYTWEEKTYNKIIKYPLKKILESYIDKDFIYRKKVGLNSSFEEWVCTQQNKQFLTSLIQKKNGISQELMGSVNLRKLLKHFNSIKPVHPNVARLVINLALSQSWIDEHKITVG
jgi:asparagine synthetase B (glutamine-hydrolysing)